MDCFQSNHEGAIIDAIQAAYGKYASIIINPGADTHSSSAILDALKAVALPGVEVDLSAVEQREAFRQASYTRMACLKTISGQGAKGYREAMRFLKQHLQSQA